MIASGGKCWAIFQTISLHVITAAIKCKNASDKMNSHYPTKSIIGLVSAFRKYYAEIPSFIWKLKVFNILQSKYCNFLLKDYHRYTQQD